ncbi:MAG: hypothetical protein OXH52_05785 [Gammaproteobacteria bacterium]|nr:hypothetical protein [Gammaproteobacteria bacterium]
MSWIVILFGYNPDLVTSTHGIIGKLNRFGNVAFEVEAEGTAPGKYLYLSLQVSTELLVECVHRTKQTAQPRHEHLRVTLIAIGLIARTVLAWFDRKGIGSIQQGTLAVDRDSIPLVGAARYQH